MFEELTIFSLNIRRSKMSSCRVALVFPNFGGCVEVLVRLSPGRKFLPSHMATSPLRKEYSHLLENRNSNVTKQIVISSGVWRSKVYETSVWHEKVMHGTTIMRFSFSGGRQYFNNKYVCSLRAKCVVLKRDDTSVWHENSYAWNKEESVRSHQFVFRQHFLSTQSLEAVKYVIPSSINAVVPTNLVTTWVPKSPNPSLTSSPQTIRSLLPMFINSAGGCGGSVTPYLCGFWMWPFYDKRKSYVFM